MRPAGTSGPSPYLLLVLTTLFWSGNFVLGRAVHLAVPPIGLAFWRWSVAALLLLPFAWGALRRSWPLIRAHLPIMVALSITGVANFNTFVYLGLQSSTATNAVLLQSNIPVVIVVLAWLILGEPVRARQLLGILCSLAGVLVLLSHGDPQVLLALRLSSGDLWLLGAVLTWALYSVLLRRRPPGLDPRALLLFTVLVGAAALAPFYLWESAGGRVMALDGVTVGSVLYVAVFPSILAYVFWNRAVAEVGPSRAGQFIHLMPVFGTLLSVIFLGERLAPYHGAGAALIVGGILFVSLGRRAP